MTRQEKLAQADTLGLEYSGNISNAKLDEMLVNAGVVLDTEDDAEAAVKAKLAEVAKNQPAKPDTVVELSDKQKKAAARKDSTRLVRCIVTPMDQSKAEYDGEIFSAGNSMSGMIKKFVKFNVEWHIPIIILNAIKAAKMVKSKSRKVDGMIVKDVVEVPAYGIQELPPLTQEELDRLKSEVSTQAKK
jgi:hypothetical protein